MTETDSTRGGAESAAAFKSRVLSKARLISLVPSSRLRVFLLRRVLGYAIDPSSRIGFGTLIRVASFTAEDHVRIGRYNRFKGPMSAVIRAGARIGGNNTFHCGRWSDGALHPGKYQRTLSIGSRAIITSSHYFDCIGSLIIGDRTVVAGRGSQFWTHGAGAGDRSVEIGGNCYVGSAVRIAPGCKIGNDNIIAMGSVVAGDLSGVTLCLIGGVPARPIGAVEKDPKSGRVFIESRGD